MKKQPTRRQKKAIAIIGEGETEQAYFSYIRGNKRYPITIKPDLPSNTDFSGIFRKARALLRSEYDLVFCLIDLDVIIQNDTIDSFMRACSELPKRIIPIASNPCTEVWFLMHFVHLPPNRLFNSCDTVIKALKSHLHQYEKGNNKTRYQKHFFIMENEGDTEQALSNALGNILFVTDDKKPFDRTFTEIATIFEQLNRCTSCNFSIECETCKQRTSTIFQRTQYQ